MIANKKSQLKIQEMSFMLLAIVIFFILAGLFFISIKQKEIYKKAEYLEKEKAKSSVAKLAETAEFSCGKPLCIDVDKLLVMQNRTDYNKFWPVKSLSIRKVFPKNNTEIICNKNNYPECGIFKIYDAGLKNIETVSSFVVLCRKESEQGYFYDKCELGKIIAGFEIK